MIDFANEKSQISPAFSRFKGLIVFAWNAELFFKYMLFQTI